MLKALIISDIRVAHKKTPSEGLAGLARHHQMPGRSWRAGESCGDGESEGRDRPLERGAGGLTKALRKRKTNFPFLSAFTIFAS